MGRTPAIVLLLAVAPVGSGGAASVSHAVLRAPVAVEIRQLGPAKIVVGRFSCTIPSKLTASAGRFVIGDPVRISCLGGTLENVRYSPLVPNQTTRPGTGNAP